MSKTSFDIVENKLIELAKQAGAKDAKVAQVMGEFYPRAWVWARRANIKYPKLGTAQHIITYEIIFETRSYDSQTAYNEAKTLYFNFFNLIWADLTLGGICQLARITGYDRDEFKTGDVFFVQWVVYVEVWL